MKEKSKDFPEYPPSFKCAYCSQEFSTLNTVFAHMNDAHERKAFLASKF